MKPDTLKLRDDSQGLDDLVLDLERRHRSMQKKDRDALLSVAFGAKLLITSIVGDQDIPLDVRRGLLNLDSAPGALKHLGDLLLEIGNDLRALGLQSDAVELERTAQHLAHSRFRRIDSGTQEFHAHMGEILHESGVGFGDDAAHIAEQQRFKRSA